MVKIVNLKIPIYNLFCMKGVPQRKILKKQAHLEKEARQLITMSNKFFKNSNIKNK